MHPGGISAAASLVARLSCGSGESRAPDDPGFVRGAETTTALSLVSACATSSVVLSCHCKQPEETIELLLNRSSWSGGDQSWMPAAQAASSDVLRSQPQRDMQKGDANLHGVAAQ